MGFFVTVKDGHICLEETIKIAQKNEPFNSSQCKLLKMLGIKMGKFRASIIATVNSNGENFQNYKN